jgi:exocyst complex component 5
VTTKAAELSSNSGSSRTAALAASAFLKVAGKSSVQERGREEAMLIEADGELSLDAAQRMLRWHAEAIGRCVELSPASDV